jgi:hypothetical protein
MSDTPQAAPQPLPPHIQLSLMSRAFMTTRLLYAAAKLELADQLANGPKSAAEIAGPAQLHAPSLHRLMRTLASLGILTERNEQRFALTPLGEALKKGAPGEARAYILLVGAPWYQSAFDNLVHSVRTGQTGFEKVTGAPLFEYLALHPDDAAIYNEAMFSVNGPEVAAVVAAYDFSVFKSVVDVGGGTGNLLAAILTKYSDLRGVLFDLPHVVADAATVLNAKDIRDRTTIQGGDFFTSAPSKGDAYILSHVIHNFTEDQCLTVLGNVRKAMNPVGRLLILEPVVQSGDAPDPGKMLDMTMLALMGGQERTEAEYRSLLGKAGFRLDRVIPTSSRVSVVEAMLA